MATRPRVFDGDCSAKIGTRISLDKAHMSTRLRHCASPTGDVYTQHMI